MSQEVQQPRRSVAALTVVYGVTTALSAFLLFLVQPILGKRILPWFGGAAAVWTTCLLFFQGVLVLGYLYCHWLVKRLTPRQQAAVHVSLLVVSCLTLPIEPGGRWKPVGDAAPLTGILALLAATVGLPYFALSTTGPLLQVWFARSMPGTVPYRLFALSNLGAMAALLGYPTVIEPVLGARVQSAAWSCGFVVFALLGAGLSWRGARARAGSAHPSPAAGPPPGPGKLALWGLLAAGPSILLLGVTRSLSLDVAPVPLLWTLPLSAYLLSFILCFGRPHWYSRRLFGALFAAALVALVWLPPSGPSTLDLRVRVAVYVGVLFAFSTTAHGELARLRPDPEHLTAFYLMIAVGGAVGATFAGVVAPALFASDLELPIGVVGMTAVLLFVLLREAGGMAEREARRRIPFAVVAVGVLGAVVLQEPWRRSRTAVVMGRSFHGSLRVADRGTGASARRTLSHGRTVHGEQFLDPARRGWATGYYSETSGGGIALRLGADRAGKRVGIIGLGAGTLLAHGRPGDDYRVYEIDSLVVDYARVYFGYLSGAEAAVSVVLGDGRLALEREAPQGFDTLVVDAFSGDAIPVHLLTREAFALYARHLSPGGILAVHTSSRFLDLAAVVKLSAEANGLQVALIHDEADEGRGVFSSDWVLAAKHGGGLAEGLVVGRAEGIEVAAGLRAWTDDDSSLVPFLR